MVGPTSDHKRQLLACLDEVARAGHSAIDTVLDRIRRSPHLCVFGIGAISYPIISALTKFTDLEISFLCDNDPSKWGKRFHGGLPCISPRELRTYGQDTAILITTQHYAEIYEQLTRMGFHNIHVITEYRLLNNEFFQDRANLDTIRHHTVPLLDILHDDESRNVLGVVVKNWFDFHVAGTGYREIFSPDQYFCPAIITLREDEAFVDAGAYNGDTLMEFIERSQARFQAVFAFELDRHNFHEMEIAVAGLDPDIRNRIRLFNLGLLDCEKDVAYEAGGSGKQSTCINMIGPSGETGRVAPLTRILEKQRVTFIKMDIEGAEVEALRGASEIIETQKPQLAVCVYHRPQHLWEVPLFLKALVPEYRIFLRHHSPLEYETVCYATVEG